MTGVDILNDIKDFDIVDNALNLSDHNPIIVSLTLDNSILPRNHSPPVHPPLASCNSKRRQCQLRWDHAFLPNYYHGTRDLVNPFTIRLT